MAYKFSDVGRIILCTLRPFDVGEANQASLALLKVRLDCSFRQLTVSVVRLIDRSKSLSR